MTNLRVLIAGGLASLVLTAPADAVTIPSNVSTPTLIGSVLAGQNYTITATGVSNIFSSFNNGAGLTFDANGKPTYAFPAPFTAFNPSGIDYDPTFPSLKYCAGGAGNPCGALIGAIVANVGDTPASYFTLGTSLSFTAGTSGYLVGLVNDVDNYGDNSGGFTVTLSSAVPEPASWALIIAGFGVIGGAMRRRQVKVSFA